jgi:hypothetical protein
MRQTIRLSVLSLLLMMNMAAAAPAAIYHVARNERGASDANDGLAPRAMGNGTGPWRTIQKAADTVNPGDTVLVGNGVCPWRVLRALYPGRCFAGVAACCSMLVIRCQARRLRGRAESLDVAPDPFGW